jgi:hypothetical protein
LSDRRLDRRIRRRSLAKEADCREANDEHNHGEEEDHLAQRRACWSGIRLWWWYVMRTRQRGPLVSAGALAGVGSSPNPANVAAKISVKMAAKASMVPHPRRDWWE